MVVLVDRPVVTVQASPEEVSTWNAVWHPLIYRFQRQDAQITDIQDILGTGFGLTITVDVEQEIEVGSQIYIDYMGTGDPNTVLSGLYTVVASSIGSGETDITIETDTAVVGTFGEGYVNFIDDRSFYMIELKIIRYDIDPSGEELTTSYAQFRPSNNAGDIVANIQSWAETLLTANNVFGYSVLNELNTNLGQSFTLELREYWKEDGYTDWVGEDLFGASPNGIVNAVKQTGDRYGQNMAEYVMYEPSGNPQVNTFGKFLTMFEYPTLFDGFPYDISFIQSENIASFTLIKSERLSDINGGSLGSTQSTLLTTGLESNPNLGVMRMSLSSYISQYASNVHRVDVTLYAESVSVDSRISEFKSVIIDHSCYDNTEYLAWLNPVGGFDYWLFYGDQENRLTTFNEVSFERYEENIGEADARSQTLKKQIQTDIVLGSDSLKKEDLQAIKYVLTSPKVYRYLGLDENDQHKWQVVKVALGSFTMPKSSQDRGDISFMIFPPETYNQQQ